MSLTCKYLRVNVTNLWFNTLQQHARNLKINPTRFTLTCPSLTSPYCTCFLRWLQMARRVGCISMQKLHRNPMGALFNRFSCLQTKNDKNTFFIKFSFSFNFWNTHLIFKDFYFILYYLKV